MKIVIVSDTHGQTDFISRLQEEEKADLYLHAGDSCLSDSEIFPFQTVMGNCDHQEHNIFLTENTPAGRIMMKHTPYRDDDLKKYKGYDYRFFVYGHTHKKKMTKKGNIFLLNPGSLYFPRDGEEGSYLVINVTDEENIDFEFKTLSKGQEKEK